MSPDRFLNGVLLTAGALIVGLCGLCTVVMVGWSLPAIFSRTSDAVYGQMVLIGALLIGGVSVFVGGALFHYARAGRQPDDLDVIASALTAFFASAYALMLGGITVYLTLGTVQSGGVSWLFWCAAFAAATFGCVRLALDGWRRYREARDKLAAKEAP